MKDGLIMAWRFVTLRCVCCGDWTMSLHCRPCKETILRLDELSEAVQHGE